MFVSSCSTLDAPISADVTRSSRSTQASASCASDWPRRSASSFSARILPSVSLSSRSRPSESLRLARESSGMPWR